MVTLEQVKLLDQRITRTVEYIKKVTGENVVLKGKIDSYEQRIGELEKLIKRFREDQNRIEDGILSALDRLNQFEDALENSLSADKQEEEKLPKPIEPDEAEAEENQDLEMLESPSAEDEPDERSFPPEKELDIF